MELTNNNFNSAEGDIAAIRSCIKNMIANKDLQNILGSDFKRNLTDWDSLISKRCNEPFTLVILGDFKRGKSTIINAMLGKELAPVSVAPETYTINEISYGEKQSVEAVLVTGERVSLTKDDISRDRLEEIMPAFPAKVAYLDIRDDAPILKEIRIVDTPGLSDLDDLDRQVTEYLMNADAIIYVASALLPFSESEQLYLASHVRPQRFGMLYVLVNMIDALSSKSDVDKIMGRISERSESIVPNAFVYGISGADEFNRKTDLPRLDDKGFREFYETEFFKFELSIRRDIILQKDIIRTKRVLTLLDSMLRETHAKINMFADMAVMDRKKLEDMTNEFEEQCSTIEAFLEAKKPSLHLSILEMQQEAERWMYEFFAKLRESVLECRPSPETGENDITAEDVEKYFYSYLMDKVGEAYRNCIETHSERINLLIDKMSEQLAEKLGISELSVVSQSNFADNIMSSIKKKVTTSVMNVAQYNTSESFPSATMSSFKLIMKRKKQTDIIDITLEKYDDIRNGTVKDMKAAYEDLENKAISRLENVFLQQIEVGRGAFVQAKEMVGNYDNAMISSTLKSVDTEINSAIKLISKYELPDE